MKISESWLREWVNPELTSQQLADQLTLAGLEVDSISPVAGVFSHVVVAAVVKTTPHPQANKLTLCEVDAGLSEPLRIVCGAANVRSGLRVALALPGAQLPGGIHIQETTLRGELSQGMLCSVTELGLDDKSDGILELPDDAPVGTDLRDYLSLNDHVLEIDLTPNRADCFSILGIARDVAAMNHVQLNRPASITAQVDSTETMSVQVLAQKACPNYCTRVIRGINPNATTPLWLKERLRRSGIRSIHPVVDVTNYVMYELGQPLHAFDQTKIAHHLCVRYAHAEETMTLLDGQSITLTDDVLVIADAEKPLALAGIMGSGDSEVDSETVDIVLESAFFHPLSISGVARRYGLFTDASQRFERGVDPQLPVQALERVTELLQAIVGGTVGPITQQLQSSYLPTPVVVSFDPTLVRRLTGLEIATETMRQSLLGLGMEVVCGASNWSVTVPTYRFDINQPVDLVEEIVRLYGYDKVVAAPMIMETQAGQNQTTQPMSHRITHFLVNRGYHETISYSFVDPVLQEALYPNTQTMRLKNPISSELSEMRVGMWPGLLASMLHNIHRQQTVLKLFEVGVVFDCSLETLVERQSVAGLLYGRYGELNWSEQDGAFDFFDMKGDLEGLFSALQVHSVEFQAKEHPALHPGKSAQVLINRLPVGWIGALHPRLVDELDLAGEVLLFELMLDGLLQNQRITYQPISKYPQTRRDLCLLVNQSISAADIERAIREVTPAECLKQYHVFDVYTGDPIPAGKKSLALALTFQNEQRTLIDTEINTIIDAILSVLTERFEIVLRAESL